MAVGGDHGLAARVHFYFTRGASGDTITQVVFTASLYRILQPINRGCSCCSPLLVSSVRLTEPPLIVDNGDCAEGDSPLLQLRFQNLPCGQNRSAWILVKVLLRNGRCVKPELKRFSQIWFSLGFRMCNFFVQDYKAWGGSSEAICGLVPSWRCNTLPSFQCLSVDWVHTTCRQVCLTPCQFQNVLFYEDMFATALLRSHFTKCHMHL